LIDETPPKDAAFKTTLNFFDDHTRTFKKVTAMEHMQLLREMREWFSDILAITLAPPFLFIECDRQPEPSSCPFLVAGLVAKFLDEDEPLPIGASFMGEAGRTYFDDVPDAILADLRRCHIPSLATFEYLFSILPAAHHITSYPHQLLVELERSSDESYVSLLQKLPVRLGDLKVGYINGTEWFDTQARTKSPDPKYRDGQYDDTNYLAAENGGALRPGVILECKGYRNVKGTIEGGMLCNAGVLVNKGSEVRFTTAKHCWDAVDDKVVYHGDRAVGRIQEVYGDDIALVQIPFAFSNDLLDVSTTAKTLQKAEDFTEGDLFVIDSAFTGRQMLEMFGVRAGLRRAPKGWRGPKEDHRYVVLEQGVCSIETPVMTSSPMVREAVCGTPLIYIGRDERGDEGILARGIVGGFMLYCANVIRTSPKERMLYCFCQTTDELLNEGWNVLNEE
jgi:hypothetical protein